MKKLILIFTALIFSNLTNSHAETSENSNLSNPNEEYLTTLESEDITNNKAGNYLKDLSEQKASENTNTQNEVREIKFRQYSDFLKPASGTFLKFNLAGNGLYQYKIDPLIESELERKNGLNKKATIDFGFNPNEYLGLYVTSSIGTINYNTNINRDVNQLNFKTNLEVLKVGVTYNF